MTTLTDYFDKVAYKPKFFLGDRVYGKHGKVLWVGTVMIDTLINHADGSFVTVWLDLPLKTDKEHKHSLKISKGRGIKYLKEIEETEKKVKKVEKTEKKVKKVEKSVKNIDDFL